jgi:Cu-Zn family superoxide dismutase
MGSMVAALAAAAFYLHGVPALAEGNHSFTFNDSQGKSIGKASLSESSAGVLIALDLLVPGGVGARAFHIHDIGLCEGPDFASAGGHYNPGNKQHGLKNAHGHHAGDLPNLHVGTQGVIKQEILVPGLTLEELLEGDGSALMIHAQSDDYSSDPAGNAGPRIACAALKP